MNGDDVRSAHLFGVLNEDELYIQDAPLADVLAHAASRAARAELETVPEEMPESDWPTIPAPPSGRGRR